MTDHTPTSGGTGDDAPEHQNTEHQNTEYHDTELGARLNADAAPQHRPDFWSDLQAELNSEAAARSTETTSTFPTVGAADASANTVQMPTVTDLNRDHTAEMSTAESAEMSTGPDARVVSLDQRRSRARVGMWLSAAAALLVVGIGAATLLNRNNDPSVIEADAAESGEVGVTDSTDAEVATDDADSDGTSSDGQTGSSNDDPSAGDADEDAAPSNVDLPPLPADYFGQLETTTIGDGRLVGFSPDDSAVLFLVDSTSGETGCEGAPVLELISQDLATGVRTPAMPAGTTIETGGLRMQLADPAGGAGTVYLREFCDGFPGTTWEATMAGNGTVTNLVELDIDVDDPFDISGSPQLAAGALVNTNDGSLAVFSDPWRVERADGSKQWFAPSEVAGVNAAIDPTGQVVALAGVDNVWLWNFRTDEVRAIGTGTLWEVSFNHSGTQLALNPTDGVGIGSVLTITTFGGAATPAEAVPTTPACSGATDLPVLQTDALVAAGLPAMVAKTVSEIDAAAAECNWDVLGALVGQEFTASFGGGDAIELWQASEQSGGSMDELRAILHQPFAAQPGQGGDSYVWPQVFVAESCDAFTDADRQSLVELGYSEEDIAADCAFADGYVGYRTSIDASGRWLFFVAGD